MPTVVGQYVDGLRNVGTCEKVRVKSRVKEVDCLDGGWIQLNLGSSGRLCCQYGLINIIHKMHEILMTS
jgi:hypothetical protein